MNPKYRLLLGGIVFMLLWMSYGLWLGLEHGVPVQ